MSSWFTCQSWANRVGAWFAPIKLSNLNRKVKNTGCTFKVHPVFFNPAQFFISYPVMWYQKYMKSRRKKSAEIRMAIGLVGIRVALIQLFPRRCAPQPSGPWPPAGFYTFLCMGLLSRKPPSPHALARGSITPQSRKAALRPLFLLRKHFYSGYIGLIIPALICASLCAAFFLAPAKYSCGMGLLSGPSLWPSIRQLG